VNEMPLQYYRIAFNQNEKVQHNPQTRGRAL